MSRIIHPIKQGYQDVDMNEEVETFFRTTGLTSFTTLTDSELLLVLNGPSLRACSWDSTLSLAHPRLATLLDDLDDRLRRFTRYHQLDDPDYVRSEDKNFSEIEEEETQARKELHRSRRFYGEAIIQDDEEKEEVIAAKKQAKALLPPPSKELVLAILRLLALVLSHSTKTHLFNSPDRLLSLLNSDDPDLITASLYVLLQLQSTTSRQQTFQSFQEQYVIGIKTKGVGQGSTMHIRTMLYTLANGVWGMRELDSESGSVAPAPALPPTAATSEPSSSEKEAVVPPANKKIKKAHGKNVSPEKHTSPQKKVKGSKKKDKTVSAPANLMDEAQTSPAAALATGSLSTNTLTPPSTLVPYVSPSAAPSMLSPTSKQLYSLLNEKTSEQITIDIKQFERLFGTAFVFPRVSVDVIAGLAASPSSSTTSSTSTSSASTAVSSASLTGAYPSVLTLSFLSQLYQQHQANFRSVSHFLSTLASPAAAIAASLPCYAIPPKHLFTLSFVLRYLLHYPSLVDRRKFFVIRLLSIQLLMTFSGQRKDVVAHVSHFDSLVVEGLIHIMRTEHVEMIPPPLQPIHTKYDHIVHVIPGVSYPTANGTVSAGAYLNHVIRATSINTLQSLSASPNIRRQLQQIGILQHGVLLTLVKQSLANLRAFMIPPTDQQPPAVIDPEQPLWWLNQTDMHLACCQANIVDHFFHFVQRLIPKSPYEPSLLNHQEVLEIMVDTFKDRSIMNGSILWRAIHIIDLCHQHSPSATIPRLNSLGAPDIMVERLLEFMSIRSDIPEIETSSPIVITEEKKEDVEMEEEKSFITTTASTIAPITIPSNSSITSTTAPSIGQPPRSTLFQLSPAYDFDSGVTVKSLIPAQLQHRKSVMIKVLYLLGDIIRHDREPIRHQSFKEGKYAQLIKQLWLQGFDWSLRGKMCHAEPRSVWEQESTTNAPAASSSTPSSVPFTTNMDTSSTTPPLVDRKRKSGFELTKEVDVQSEAIGSAGTSSPTVDELTSPKKPKLSSPIVWGEELFRIACQLVVALSQNNPSCIKQLHGASVTKTFIQCFDYDIIGALTLQSLPETIRTLCLHTDARDLLIRHSTRSPLKDLIQTAFLSQHPRHIHALEPHALTFAKNVEEFLRHYGRTALTTTPSDTLTRDFMIFFSHLVDLLYQQGRDLARITALKPTAIEWLEAPIIGGMRLQPESYISYSRRLSSYSRFLEILFKNFGSNFIATTGDKPETANQLIQTHLQRMTQSLIRLAFERNLSPSLSGVFVGAKATELLFNEAGEKINSHISSPSHSQMGEPYSTNKWNAFFFPGFIPPLIILSNKPEYGQTIYRYVIKEAAQLLQDCHNAPRLRADAKLPHSYLRFVDRDRKMEVLGDEQRLEPIRSRTNDFQSLIDSQLEFEQDELLAQELCQLSALNWCTHLFSRLTRRLPVNEFIRSITPPPSVLMADTDYSFSHDIYRPLIGVYKRVQAVIAWDQIETLQITREMDAFNAQIARVEAEQAAIIEADPSTPITPKRVFTFIRSPSSISTDLYHSSVSKSNQYTWKLLGSLLKVARLAESAGTGASTIAKQNSSDAKRMYDFLAQGLVSLLSVPPIPSPHRTGLPPQAFQSTEWALSKHLETHLYVCRYLKPILVLIRTLLYMSTSLMQMSPSVQPHELNATLFAAMREAGGGTKLLKMLRWTMIQRIYLAQHLERTATSAYSSVGSTSSPDLSGSPVALKEVLAGYDEILAEFGTFIDHLARHDSEKVSSTATTSTTPSSIDPPSIYETELAACSPSEVVDHPTHKFAPLVTQECWTKYQPLAGVTSQTSPKDKPIVIFHSLQYLPPTFVSSIFIALNRVILSALKRETGEIRAKIEREEKAEKDAKAKLEKEAKEKAEKEKAEKEKVEKEKADQEKAEKDATTTTTTTATPPAATSSTTSATPASSAASASSTTGPITSGSTSPSLRPATATTSPSLAPLRPIRDVPLLSSMHESLITELIGMGFSRVAAQASLIATQSTSPELNIEWLFGHPDEIAIAEAEQQQAEMDQQAATARREAAAKAKEAQLAAAAAREKELNDAAAAMKAAAAASAPAASPVPELTIWERIWGTKDVLGFVIRPMLDSIASLPLTTFSKDGINAFPCMQPTPANIGSDAQTTVSSLVHHLVHFLTAVSAPTPTIPSALGPSFRQQLVDELIARSIRTAQPIQALPLPTPTPQFNPTPSTPMTLTSDELTFQRSHSILYLFAGYLHQDETALKELDLSQLSPFLIDMIKRIRGWSQSPEYVHYLDTIKSDILTAKAMEEKKKKIPPPTPANEKERKEQEKKAEKEKENEKEKPTLNPMHESYIGTLQYLLNIMILEAVRTHELVTKTPTLVPPKRSFYPLSNNSDVLELSIQLLQTPLFQQKCLSSICSIIASLTHHEPFVNQFIDAGGVQILLRLPTAPPVPVGDSKSCAPAVSDSFATSPMYLLLTRLISLSSKHYQTVIHQLLEALVCDLHRAMLRVRQREADEKQKELQALSGSDQPLHIELSSATHPTPSPQPSNSTRAGFLTPQVPFSPSVAGAVNTKSNLIPATPLPPLVFHTPAKKGSKTNQNQAHPPTHAKSQDKGKNEKEKEKGKGGKNHGKKGRSTAAPPAAASSSTSHKKESKDKHKQSLDEMSELASQPSITPIALDFHPVLNHVLLLQFLVDELETQSHLLPLVWSFHPNRVPGVDCTHSSLVSLLCHQMLIDPLQQFTSVIALTDFELALCHYQPEKSKKEAEKKKGEKKETKKKKGEPEEKKDEEEEKSTTTPSPTPATKKGTDKKDAKKSTTAESLKEAAAASSSPTPALVDPSFPPAPTTLDMTRVIIGEITSSIYMLIAKGRPHLTSHHSQHQHTHIPRHASAILKAIHHHKQTSYLSMYTSDSACASLLHQKSETEPASTGSLHLALRTVIHTLIGLSNMLSVIFSKSPDSNLTPQQHRRKIARIFVDGNTHAVLGGILAWMEFNAFSGTKLGVQLIECATKLVENIVRLDAIYPLRAKESDKDGHHRHGRKSKKKSRKRKNKRGDVVLIDDGEGGVISVIGGSSGSNRGRDGQSYIVDDDDELGDDDGHDDDEDDEDGHMDDAEVNRLFAEIQGEADDMEDENNEEDQIDEQDQEALIQNAVGGDQDELEEAAEEQAAEGEDEDDDELMMDLGEEGLGSDEDDDDDDGDDDMDDGDEDEDGDIDGDDDDLGSLDDDSDSDLDISDGDDDLSEEDDEDDESDSDGDEDDEDDEDEDEDGTTSGSDSDTADEHEHSGNEDEEDEDAQIEAGAAADEAVEGELEMELVDGDESGVLGRGDDEDDDEDDDDEHGGPMFGDDEDEDDDEDNPEMGHNPRAHSHRHVPGMGRAHFIHLPMPTGAIPQHAADAFTRMMISFGGPNGVPLFGRPNGGPLGERGRGHGPQVAISFGGPHATRHRSRARLVDASGSPVPGGAMSVSEANNQLHSALTAIRNAYQHAASAAASSSSLSASPSSASPPPPPPSTSQPIAAPSPAEASRVDQSVLMELPEEIRAEIMAQQLGAVSGTSSTGGGASTRPDLEALRANFPYLGMEMQEEILAQQADPDEFLGSLDPIALGDFLYQRHLIESGSRGARRGGASAWTGMMSDYAEEDEDQRTPRPDEQEEKKQTEEKEREEKSGEGEATGMTDEEFDFELDTADPLLPYTHLSPKELNDRSLDSHPHPLLCPSLLVPIVRVLYMSQINSPTNLNIFRTADHICVYQSTRHTLLSFVMALLRGIYTKQQTNDHMIKKMIDALPAGVLLGTKDDVTGTNLSTFSTHHSNLHHQLDRPVGLPTLLSLRLLDLVAHLASRRKFGTAKFFFSPAHLTSGSMEPQSEDENTFMNVQDLSEFSLQDALTASPTIKPATVPQRSLSKKELKKEKKKQTKADKKKELTSPGLTPLPPSIMSSSLASVAPLSPNLFSPPPIIDLFALLGSPKVCNDRDHVRTLTSLLATIVDLPTHLLADLRAYRKEQALKREKEAAARAKREAEAKKKREENEPTKMEIDEEETKPATSTAPTAAAAASSSLTKVNEKSSSTKADAKKSKTEEKKSKLESSKATKKSTNTPAKKSLSIESTPSTTVSTHTYPPALVAEDDEHIWTDPHFPFPLPPCPILPGWCFTFLFATLSFDGYPERSLEAVMRILLYFGERKKNRELIIREIVSSIVKLSEGIQADMKTLVQMNATDAKPMPPQPITPTQSQQTEVLSQSLSLTESGRKRKRSDSDMTQPLPITPTLLGPVNSLDTPIAVSASTLMWSISQRESTLLRFVRILNTISLIDPPQVTTVEEAKEEAAKLKSASSTETKKTDEETSSNLTSLIKLPPWSTDAGLLSPGSIAANKLLLKELGFTDHTQTLWSAMDSYFDIVEKRNTGFVVIEKPNEDEGKKDEKKGKKESATGATPKKPPSDAAIEKAEKAAAEKAAALSKKLEDHRRDLTEESSDSSTTRESDLLLLMHLPLIEAYFIFFAPRTQPKIHNSLEMEESREQLATEILAIEQAETKMDDAAPSAAPHISRQDSILAKLLPSATASTATAPDNSALASFYAFTFKHRRPLNVALRQHKNLLQTSMRSLLWHPHKILDFDIRRKYFKNEIKKMISKIKSHGNMGQGIKLQVKRDRIFEDSYQQLRHYKNKDDLLRSKLNIKFLGEEGLDAGGLAREFYLVLSRAIFNADNALFKPAADNPAVFQPNPQSHIHGPDHLEFFKFAGRFVAKALIDNQRLDAYFTRSFYKHLLSIAPSFPDVESVDPEKAKSLQWMLNNSIDHILFETFSVESSNFGEDKIDDLIPNGRHIQVTDENKKLYVHLISEFILTRAIKPQLSNFLKGFHELIPAHLVSVFNEQELELMLCGLPDIDLVDLKKNIEYRGFGSNTTGSDSHIIDWFWQIISEFNQQEKALLVLFVTGTSKIPLEGFKALQGTNGITRFTVQKANGVDGLPQAHTCFNQLDLPDYTSIDVMREKLLMAIREGSQGFGFR